MVGAVTVLTRAVRVVSRGARGRGGWRETQTSSADPSGALSLGQECSGPEGPRQGRWGRGSGRAWARAEPGLFSALELWYLTHCDQIPASLNLPVMSTSCEWTALGDDQEAS